MKNDIKLTWVQQKNILGCIILGSALIITFLKSQFVRLPFLLIISACLWIVARQYRKNTDHKDLLVKSFLTVFWYAAAVYVTFLAVLSTGVVFS